MGKIKPYFAVSGLLLLVFLIACRNHPDVTGSRKPRSLVIFNAGSLSVPFKALADSFMRRYPDIRIQSESAGSLDCIRKITDLNKPCDILASADYSLIDKLMIPGYASWNLKFASNELVLAYQKDSRKSDIINDRNWTGIVTDPEIRTGRSDPDSDPCGYRTLLCLELAEHYYNQPGLTARMLRKDEKYIRPKEVDLLALLESGTIDYIFIYKSVAIQHRLLFTKLPDSVNLGNPDLADLYSRVSVNVAGNKPGETIEQHGEPMVYGITVPKTSQNPGAAGLFIEFLFTGGMDILKNNGQTPVHPSLSEAISLPDSLKRLFR